jgi:putative addiction module component (TIGR02574 family)
MSASTLNLADEALLLPVEARIALVDKLLESINPHGGKTLDALWAAEAEKRAIEIESGTVRTLNGEEVFAQIRQRLAGA